MLVAERANHFRWTCVHDRCLWWNNFSRIRQIFRWRCWAARTRKLSNCLIFAGITVLANAFGVAATRKLKGLSTFVIQWYYALTSSLITGICVLAQEKSFYTVFTDSTWQVWAMVLALCILNNLGQNLGNWIIHRANPVVVLVMQQGGVFFNLAFDLLLFDITFTVF